MSSLQAFIEAISWMLLCCVASDDVEKFLHRPSSFVSFRWAIVNLPLTPIQSISAQTELVSVEGVAPSWLKIHNFKIIWF
jgi:hypothetical protein